VAGDPIIEAFLERQRGHDRVQAIALLGVWLAVPLALAFGALWSRIISVLMLLAAVLYGAYDERRPMRRALARGACHEGTLVVHGPELLELRTVRGSVFVRGSHIEHGRDLRPAALWARARGRAVTRVVGEIERRPARPEELPGSYRGEATVDIIEGTLETPVWIVR
jgi:hypothetical protein